MSLGANCRVYALHDMAYRDNVAWYNTGEGLGPWHTHPGDGLQHALCTLHVACKPLPRLLPGLSMR